MKDGGLTTKYYLKKYVWAEVFIKYIEKVLLSAYPDLNKKYSFLKENNPFSKLPEPLERKSLKILNKRKSELNEFILLWILNNRGVFLKENNSIRYLSLDYLFKKILVNSYFLLETDLSKLDSDKRHLVNVFRELWKNYVQTKFDKYEDEELFFKTLNNELLYSIDFDG